jgi:hypothetical protein
MRKRATLVGEKTGGAAHAGVFYRIDDHFGIGISDEVKATDGLETAKKLAESRAAEKVRVWKLAG